MFMLGIGILIGMSGSVLVAGYGCLHYVEKRERRLDY